MAREIITIEYIFDRLYYRYKQRGMSLLSIMNLTARVYVMLEEIRKVGD